MANRIIRTLASLALVSAASTHAPRPALAVDAPPDAAAGAGTDDAGGAEAADDVEVDGDDAGDAGADGDDAAAGDAGDAEGDAGDADVAGDTADPSDAVDAADVAADDASEVAGGSGGGAVLVGAGDIASCSSRGDEATARILDRVPGTVATFGDNAYGRGTPREFADCYGPSWGRHKGRTRPAVGNHEYRTPGARGYFGYFGARAGAAGKGYYSYRLGSWHVVVLNSNCGRVGGCGAGSRQERWLRADLAAHRTRCTLAYWHHPRWSSGKHGGTGAVGPLWRALYEAGADVVLAGHDHAYERFAPLDPAGRADRGRGIRSFVVGTGGASHYGFRRAAPGSQVRHAGTYGVLKLTLRAGDYDWRFLPVAGESFTDRGSGRCH